MEESRCKIVVADTEDCRYSNLLDYMVRGVEDPRCRSLQPRATTEVEDCRCNNVSITMEDPRCMGLILKW